MKRVLTAKERKARADKKWREERIGKPYPGFHIDEEKYNEYLRKKQEMYG